MFAFLDSLVPWWDDLSFARQFFFGVGIVSGVLLLALFVLTLFGSGHAEAVDAVHTELAADGVSIFSVKPVTGFFLGFGWVGVIATGEGASPMVAALFGLGTGGVIMVGIYGLLRFFYSMRSDGTMRFNDAVGAIGTVYLSIPASRGGGGQVTVAFRNRQETVAAITESATPIPSGEKVKVARLLDSRTLVVERL